MEITVYEGELHKRSKRWYINFASIFIFLIVVTLFTLDFVWAIILFLLVWAYMMVGLKSTQKIKIKQMDEWLKIWTRLYPWAELSWFVIEIDKDTEKIKNIIFIRWNNHYIHTLADQPEKIKDFVMNLNNKIPMVSDYPKDFLEKMQRTLKL